MAVQNVHSHFRVKRKIVQQKTVLWTVKWEIGKNGPVAVQNVLIFYKMDPMFSLKKKELDKLSKNLTPMDNLVMIFNQLKFSHVI